MIYKKAKACITLIRTFDLHLTTFIRKLYGNTNRSCSPEEEDLSGTHTERGYSYRTVIEGKLYSL